MTARAKKKPTPKIDPAIMRAIEVVAERTAKRAVNRAMKQFVLQLGINAETPTGVIENQADTAFLRRVRVAAQGAPAKLGLAVLGAGLSIIGGFILYFSKHFVETYIWK